MNIDCPGCKSTVPLNKHCGNCGFKLMSDGVELNKNTPPTPIIGDKKSKQSRWPVGVGIFLAIWILGDVVVSILLAVFNMETDNSNRYTGGFTFIFGVIMMFAYVFRDSDQIEVTEELNVKP